MYGLEYIILQLVTRMPSVAAGRLQQEENCERVVPIDDCEGEVGDSNTQARHLGFHRGTGTMISRPPPSSGVTLREGDTHTMRFLSRLSVLSHPVFCFQRW
jgi:hypothetical protein